mmetsp:Transcript_148308/g.413089  ORF Transcript_148308/g.413089 Transcript_148308/m.413089 type:complete len:855 (-) Transcript_148308:131-2695(-)
MAGQKKKPEYVTKDDLKEVSDVLAVLTAELDDAKVELQAETKNLVDIACSELHESWQEEMAKASRSIEANRTAVSHVQATASNLVPRLDELAACQASLGERLEQGRREAEAGAQRDRQEMSAVVARIEEGLAEARSALDARAAELLARATAHAERAAEAAAGTAREELHGARAFLDQCLQQRLAALEERMRRGLEEGLAALGARLDAELAALSSKHEEAVEATTTTLRQEVSASSATARKAAKEDAARLEATHASSTAAQKAALDHVEAEVGRCLSEIERLEEQLGLAAKETQTVRGNAEQQLVTCQKENSARIVQLESHISRLQDLCSQVGGMPTRQIEWRIEHSGIQTVQGSTEGEESTGESSDKSSLFSPRFQAVGACGLQLELRLEKHRGLSAEDPQDSADCSVYLWAPGGLRLVFRIAVGSESALQRHSFDGKTPSGSRNLFCLADHVCPEDGSLCIVLEIHEAMQDVKPLFGSVHPPTAETAIAKVSAAGERDDGEQPRLPIDGALAMQQYFNHRLLELIQSQQRGLLEAMQCKIDVMRSRSIRRVQWRLDHASTLRQCFAEGVPICSTSFQAAGINGMQLVFYPSGCSGAKEGFCSFFIACPAGCTMRCWLWAGRWRREARPEPAEKHDLLGRVNFCRFDACVDPSDESVELGLEIEEAQQLARPSGSPLPGTPALQPLHPLPTAHEEADAGDATSPAAVLAAVLVPEAASSPGAGGGKDGLLCTLDRMDVSALRVQHMASSRPPTRDRSASERVKQLPSIWTTHGFRTFSELRDEASRGISRTPGTARGGSALSSETGPVLPRPSTTGGMYCTSRGGCRPTPRLFAETSKLSATVPVQKYKEYLAP